jgi:hypothetical protein
MMQARLCGGRLTARPPKSALSRASRSGKEQGMRLELGTSIRCTDEVYGKLADVVIDPIAKQVTHLVVEPKNGDDIARLVPIDLVETGGDDAHEVKLRCTAEDVRQLEHVHEFAYLRMGQTPTSDPDWDVGIEDVLALPYYESPEIIGYGGGVGDASVQYDRVPKGDVEVRRSSAVIAADDHFLGKVDGFVVDDTHITHASIPDRCRGSGRARDRQSARSRSA